MHGGKSNTHIPYGIRNGRTYAAREVATGFACRCDCPGCGRSLVAKNAGSQRRAHFSHYRLNPDCKRAGETSIHRHAKQLIAEKAWLVLPAWNGTPVMPNPPQQRDDAGYLHLGRDVGIPSQRSTFVEAQMEKRHGDLQPDVSAIDAEGSLLIEVRVSHAVGDCKIAKVQSDGIRMLEIDLSKVTMEEALDPDRFENLVLNDVSNRQWLSHPGAANAWQDSRRELKRGLLEINRRIAAEGIREKARQLKVKTEENACAWPTQSRGLQPPIQSIPSDSTVGRHVWHENLGVGLVLERIVEASPVYTVQFDGGRLRKLLLRHDFSDWKFVVFEQAQSTDADLTTADPLLRGATIASAE